MQGNAHDVITMDPGNQEDQAFLAAPERPLGQAKTLPDPPTPRPTSAIDDTSKLLILRGDTSMVIPTICICQAVTGVILVVVKPVS